MNRQRSGHRRGIFPRTALPLLAPLFACALFATACGEGGSAKLSGVIRTPPLRVSSVVLPDEAPTANGHSFTMRGPSTGLLLVYFGYTNCPDLCPTTLADIGHAIRDLSSNDRKRVDVAFVTVDPERDTGAVMNSFLHHFVSFGHALRTTDVALEASSQKAFLVQAKKVVTDGEISFDHTGTTFAVDDRGTVVLEWPFGVGADAMRRDITTLLARMTKKEANS